MIRRPVARARLALLAIFAAAACAPEPEPEPMASGVCDAPTTWATLPQQVRETSGLAASRRHAGVFWTHNDSGGDSAVFAIDSSGHVLARVRITGATNRDWEDIAVGPCDPGSDRDCLFLGDIGDNREHHPRIAVFRVPEPHPARDSASAPARRIPAAYPDGARDAEALFVTDAGIHIVTKGRSQAIDLYRLPPPYSSGRTRQLLHVQRLAPPPTSVSAQVTAAAAHPDGRTILIRTYASIRFLEPDGDTLRPLGPHSDLIAPDQLLGEGADFLADGRIVLTGEGGPSQNASLLVVRCHPRSPDPASAADRPSVLNR